MFIKILSDLHLEHEDFQDVMGGPVDVLVLAGDINVGRTNTRKTLRNFAERYKEVIYIMGNHEAYGGKISDWDAPTEDHILARLPSNVHFLNPGVKKIGDVTFIGATLWTNFGNDPFAEDAARRGITDFYLIRDANPAKYIEMYERDLEFIKFHYENTPGKKVIVTHFLPARECVSERWRKYDMHTNLLNKYFANNLDSWIEGMKDTTWIFGHTHDSRDFMIGDTRLIANPKGYRVENAEAFNPNLVVEV